MQVIAIIILLLPILSINFPINGETIAKYLKLRDLLLEVKYGIINNLPA